MILGASQEGFGQFVILSLGFELGVLSLGLA